MGNNPILINDSLGEAVTLPNSSENFQKQFTQATSALISSGAGDLDINAVESTGNIKVVETNSDNSSYDSKTKTVSWNPNVGVATDNGDMSATAVLRYWFPTFFKRGFESLPLRLRPP